MEDLAAQEARIEREIAELQQFLTPRPTRTMTEGTSSAHSTPDDETQPRDLSGDLDQEDVSQASAPAPATVTGGITLTPEQFQQLLAL